MSNEGDKRYRYGADPDDAFRVGVQAGLDHAAKNLGARPAREVDRVGAWEHQRRVEEKVTTYFGRYVLKADVPRLEAGVRVTGHRDAPHLLALGDLLPAGKCAAGSLGWFKITVEFEPSEGKDRFGRDFFTREDALEVLEQTLGGDLQGYFGLRRDLRCVGDREWEIWESNWNRPIAAGTLAEMFGVAKRHRWLPGDVARLKPTDEELFPPISKA